MMVYTETKAVEIKGKVILMASLHLSLDVFLGPVIEFRGWTLESLSSSQVTMTRKTKNGMAKLNANQMSSSLMYEVTGIPAMIL